MRYLLIKLLLFTLLVLNAQEKQPLFLSLDYGFASTNEFSNLGQENLSKNSYITYNVSLGLSIPVDKKLQFETGISKKEITFYSDEFRRIKSTNESEQIIIYFDGHTFFQETYLGIPLILNYSNNKHGFSPLISAGFIANFHLRSQKTNYTTDEVNSDDFNRKLRRWHQPNNQLATEDYFAGNDPGFFMPLYLKLGLFYTNRKAKYSIYADYYRSLQYSGRNALGLNFSYAVNLRAIENSVKKEYRNNLFIELLGSSFLYSVNYERSLFRKHTSNFNLRSGIIVLNRYAAPNLGINYTVGKIHKAEFGLNALFTEQRFKENDFTLIFGYRYVKNRILIRLTYTPFFAFKTNSSAYQRYAMSETDYPIFQNHYGGVSFGFRL